MRHFSPFSDLEKALHQTKSIWPDGSCYHAARVTLLFASHRACGEQCRRHDINFGTPGFFGASTQLCCCAVWLKCLMGPIAVGKD
jgi:hypothetical protein